MASSCIASSSAFTAATSDSACRLRRHEPPAAVTLEARALAQSLAATVLTPERGDFNDGLAALGPPALAARLGHGMM